MSESQIRRGLERQVEERRRLLSEGRRSRGWKAGFGAPSALEKFGLDGPLLGFMTDATVLDDGARVDIGTWKRPVAEPELAMWIGEDLEGDGDDEKARAAIAALSPAIELADVDPPPEAVEDILAANIFHRGVIFGDRDPDRRGGVLDGLEARIRIDGDPVEPPAHLEELTGRIPRILAHMAALLADHGERIRAGDVVICGSVTPPLSLSPDTTVEFELAPFSPITVHTR